MFTHDYTGVQESGGFTPVPVGEYWLKVMDTKEGHTGKGDRMVDVTLEVTNDIQYNGKKVWHKVSFLPAKQKDGTPTPGAGISKHWLHCLGEPFEAHAAVNHLAWRGKRLKVKLGLDTYIGRDDKEKNKNVIDEIFLPEEAKAAVDASLQEVEVIDSVPF